MALIMMSRRNLGRHIEDLYQNNVAEIKSQLENIYYVYTTGDVWSAKKSFLGVTCHWINPDSVKKLP